MTKMNAPGVPVNVSEEAFLTAVLHFDRTTGAQSEETRVDLKGDVLASAECATDPSENEAHFFG